MRVLTLYIGQKAILQKFSSVPFGLLSQGDALGCLIAASLGLNGYPTFYFVAEPG